MADVPAPRAASVTGVSRGLGVGLAPELLAHAFEVVGTGRSAHASLRHPRFHLVAANLGRIELRDAIVSKIFDVLAARLSAELVDDRGGAHHLRDCIGCLAMLR